MTQREKITDGSSGYLKQTEQASGGHGTPLSLLAPSQKSISLALFMVITGWSAACRTVKFEALNFGCTFTAQNQIYHIGTRRVPDITVILEKSTHRTNQALRHCI